MGYSNLRQWIEQLRKDKDLAVIEAPVDPHLELAEIHRRVTREEGPALLFTNVKGTPFPVVTNLFGTARRVEQVFGARPEQVMQSMTGAFETLLPPTMGGMWKEKGTLFNLLKAGVKDIPPGEAPVLGVSRSTNPLAELPRITSSQEEGGSFITLPLVYTESITNPQNYNLGMYPIQIYDDHTTRIHWQIDKGGSFHQHEAEVRGEPLPVSFFIGGPPALIAAAATPVPERMPELLLASLILGRRLPLVKDPLGGHHIPAEAEFAIRGLMPPHERRAEAALGLPGAHYPLKPNYPVMHVQRMWHRKDAIYPAAIADTLQREEIYLNDYLQRLLSPLYPLLMPSVRSLWSYSEAGPHALVSAVVRDSCSSEALASAFRILGEGQLSSTQFLLLTSEPVELIDFAALLQTVLERFDPAVDLFVFNHTSDSKGIMLGIGSPIRNLPYTYEEGEIPGIHEALPYCRGCLTVSGASYEEDPELPGRLVAILREKGTAWPLIVVVDDAAAAVRTKTSFLWTVFTRFNPAAELYAESTVTNHHIGYKLPIVIDARMKPGDPVELAPDEAVVKLVDGNWNNYFPV